MTPGAPSPAHRAVADTAQLTITHHIGVTVTTHSDFDDARRALQDHLKRTDTYLHTVTVAPEGTASFRLIRLDETGRHPTAVATASITADPTARPRHTHTSSAAANPPTLPTPSAIVTQERSPL